MNKDDLLDIITASDDTWTFNDFFEMQEFDKSDFVLRRWLRNLLGTEMVIKRKVYIGTVYHEYARSPLIMRDELHDLVKSNIGKTMREVMEVTELKDFQLYALLEYMDLKPKFKPFGYCDFHHGTERTQYDKVDFDNLICGDI